MAGFGGSDFKQRSGEDRKGEAPARLLGDSIFPGVVIRVVPVECSGVVSLRFREADGDGDRCCNWSWLAPDTSMRTMFRCRVMPDAGPGSDGSRSLDGIECEEADDEGGCEWSELEELSLCAERLVGSLEGSGSGHG